MPNPFPVPRTKILIPRRRGELLSRPRLLNLLNEFLDARLLIISAPPGYGKTSLLVDFAHSTDLAVCWLAVDALDQDIHRFLAHFIASLHLRFPLFGQLSLDSLRTSTQENLNLDTLTTTLVNDAYEHIKEHFVLVLDDYHLLSENPKVEAFLTAFIRNADENCHLVLCSRSLIVLPDLPLMVARAQVAGLGYEDLAFTPDEIQDLMRQRFKLVIPNEKAEQLAEQTEGWITGLLLSSQINNLESGSPRSARALGISLYDFLTSQVFEQQPADLQQFLLRSALLDEFDAATCRDVIGEALGLPEQDWDALIEKTLAYNLFILPVGEDSVTLRYHNLFRDYLSERMQRERPQETRCILLRLAAIYSQRHDWDHAYLLYRQMEQTEQMVKLVELAGAELIANGRLVTLGVWLSELPIGSMETSPGLLSIQGSVAHQRGDTSLSLALLGQAIEGFRSAQNTIGLTQALIRRSTVNRQLGSYALALRDAEEALAHSGQNPDMLPFRADALRVKGTSLFQLGRLRDAHECLNRSVLDYQGIHDELSAAQVLLEIGLVNQSLGSCQAAEAVYERALKYFQSKNNLVWQANILNNLGVLQHLRGDYLAASQTLEKAILSARTGFYPRLEAYSLASIGDLYRDLDALDEAQEAYNQARGISYHINDQVLGIYLDLAEAILARLRGNAAQASQMIFAAEQKAEAGGSPFELNLCRLEWTLEHLMVRNSREVLPVVTETLHYFSTEGHLIEIGLATLYQAMASFQTGDAAACATQLAKVLPMIDSADTQQPFITAGRAVKPILEMMKTPSQLVRMSTHLLQRIRDFETRLPLLRKQLRPHTTAIPFAPPRLIIRALGRMQVRINGSLIRTADWQSTAARDLFFLILSNAEGLSKEETGAILWPDSSPSELKLRFKNTVYRLRRAIGRDTISFDDEIYRFNRSLDYEYDVETFLNELRRSEQAVTPEGRIRHYQAAVNTYKGDYLPGVGETWVINVRERLHRLFMDAILKLVNLHIQGKNYNRALEYCQRALEIDPCCEDAHRFSMQAYAALGNRPGIQRQYDLCRRTLLKEMDVAPTAQTEKMYIDFLK